MNTLVVSPSGRRLRCKHSPEFKTSVIRACQQPGMSMAAVALANGLNANMLRKWVTTAESVGVMGSVASVAHGEERPVTEVAALARRLHLTLGVIGQG